MPLLTFACLYLLYLKLGVDPEKDKPIVVSYEPPQGLTPAELGTLVDERADNSDIISSVIDLAVRGYLRIDEISSNSF